MAPADPPDSRNVPPNDGTGTLLFTASRRAHRRRFPVPGWRQTLAFRAGLPNATTT